MGNYNSSFNGNVPAMWLVTKNGNVPAMWLVTKFHVTVIQTKLKIVA
jgi:hypothetical protein